MASSTTCQISSASSARRIGSGATASPLRRSAVDSCAPGRSRPHHPTGRQTADDSAAHAGEDGDAGERGTARRGQHQPWDRDGHDHVPAHGYGVSHDQEGQRCHEPREERAAVARALEPPGRAAPEVGSGRLAASVTTSTIEQVAARVQPLDLSCRNLVRDERGRARGRAGTCCSANGFLPESSDPGFLRWVQLTASAVLVGVWFWRGPGVRLAFFVGSASRGSRMLRRCAGRHLDLCLLAIVTGRRTVRSSSNPPMSTHMHKTTRRELRATALLAAATTVLGLTLTGTANAKGGEPGDDTTSGTTAGSSAGDYAVTVNGATYNPAPGRDTKAHRSPPRPPKPARPPPGRSRQAVVWAACSVRTRSNSARARQLHQGLPSSESDPGLTSRPAGSEQPDPDRRLALRPGHIDRPGPPPGGRPRPSP